MTYYCTLFDSQFYTQGMALYKSLLKHCDDFTLYVLAFDEECYRRLSEEQHVHLHVISLLEIENKALLLAKSNRSHGEYAWTCSSAICQYVMKNFNPPHITYLDADLFFFENPAPMIEKYQNPASALITPHNYDKKTAWYEKEHGTFCVQFVCFYNNEEGKKILSSWYAQCLAWCYSRLEDGKFGDQKYLDDWPQNFRDVQILSLPGVTAAPWNSLRYQIKEINHCLYVRDHENKTDYQKLIYFHFHNVKCLSDNRIDWKKFFLYHVPVNTIKRLYQPYLRTIGVHMSYSKILSQLLLFRTQKIMNVFLNLLYRIARKICGLLGLRRSQ